jgi:N utilization substance protein B
MSLPIQHVKTTHNFAVEDFQMEVRPYAQLSQHEIRSIVFNLLYAMESFEYTSSLSSIVDNFNCGFGFDIPSSSEAVTMAHGIINDRDKLDNVYKPLLTNWRFERVSVSAKLILRLAIWELQTKDIDPRIVINEAIELAKDFAEEDAYRFINGILDRIVNPDEGVLL